MNEEDSLKWMQSPDKGLKVNLLIAVFLYFSRAVTAFSLKTF